MSDRVWMPAGAAAAVGGARKAPPSVAGQVAAPTSGHSDLQEKGYAFTVFTPTYNRAHTLHRVHDSLMAQTFRDFEWLVVDDGSTDGTRDLVEKWSESSGFPIRYRFQEQSGKHVALNRAVRSARGEFFLTLDSDDACVPHALERFMRHWDTIPDGEKHEFSAVTASCMDEDGRMVGDRFPQHITDSNPLDVRFRLKVRGEKWGFQRTDIMRQFPFPVPECKLSHVPEDIVWNRIARRYKTRYVNDLLRVYYRTESNSITADEVEVTRHAHAYMLGKLATLNEHIEYLRHSPIDFLKTATQYVRFSLHLRRTLADILSVLENRRSKLLCLAAFPLGCGLSACDVMRAKWTARVREAP